MFSQAKYTAVPTSEPIHLSSYPSTFSLSQDTPFDDECRDAERPSYRPRLPAFDSDPRFYKPTPSPYTRAALLLFVAVMFWLAISMRRDVWENFLGDQEGVQVDETEWTQW